MATSRVVDTEEIKRTFSKGNPLKSWAKDSFSRVTSTTLPSLGFVGGSGANTHTYRFSTSTILEQKINWAWARFRGRMVLYSSSSSNPMTAQTAFGKIASNLSMVQSISIHDQNGGSIINQSQGEVPWGANLDLALRPLMAFEGSDDELDFHPLGDQSYDGSDLYTQTAGTNLMPFLSQPYSETDPRTFVDNPQLNAAAVRSAKRSRQQYVYNATCGPAGQQGWISRQPMDHFRIGDFGSGARTLDWIQHGGNYTIELKLNGLPTSNSYCAPFWSNLPAGTSLYAYFPDGLSLAYDCVQLDPTLDNKYLSMFKHGFTKTMGYLDCNIVQGLAGMVNSTATQVSLNINSWVRPVCVVLSAIPTGALLNPSRSSFLHSQVQFSNYQLRSGNIPTQLEPINNLEQAYESLQSWADIPSTDGFLKSCLPDWISFAEFQSFATHYVSDNRSLLKDFGGSPQQLSITANRTDNNGQAVDYIVTVWCLRELEYVIKDNTVHVRQTA